MQIYTNMIRVYFEIEVCSQLREKHSNETITHIFDLLEHNFILQIVNKLLFYRHTIDLFFSITSQS